MIESAPNQHKFKLAVFQPNDPKNFIKFVRKELQLLKSSLPSGIFVKGFEDRMDLYSVMIKGPEKTPYEDGLFFFDFQLPSGILYFNGIFITYNLMLQTGKVSFFPGYIYEKT